MIDYDKKSPWRTAKKTCAKCGKAGWYRPRETRCKRQKFGPGSFWCYGALSAVAKKPDPLGLRPAPGLAIGSLLGEEGLALAVADRGVRIRADAAKKLAAARDRITDKTRQMTRLATSLRMWEKRASYYAKRASLTDAELEQERQTRMARAKRKPRRRGIAVGGEL